MPKLKQLSRADPPKRLLEEVVYNDHALQNHAIPLPANATPEQTREALRKLLDMFARKN